jgi:hypothetical protein
VLYGKHDQVSGLLEQSVMTVSRNVRIEYVPSGKLEGLAEDAGFDAGPAPPVEVGVSVPESEVSWD